MAADKRKLDIPDEVIQSLARTLLPAIREYFESEKGQRKFAEWKEKRAEEQTVAEAAESE